MAKPFIKPIITPEEAAGKVSGGSTLMVGGFNYAGAPYTLIAALAAAGTKDIDLICVDASHHNKNTPEPVGVAKLIANGQLRSMSASHIGLNSLAQELCSNGSLSITLMPMGTFAERIRAGGAGLGGILTPAGVGTPYEEGRMTLMLNGKKYIVEPPLRAEVAFVRAWRADAAGKLTYYGTGSNFNPLMATAADYVIAEVDEVLPLGGLDPNSVTTPGILVDALVLKGDDPYAART